MPPITLEDLQKALRDRVGGMWKLRSCSICYTPLFYLIVSEDTVLFDPNCNCTRNWTEPQANTAQEFLDGTFNLQTDPAARERMWSEFLLVQANPARAKRWA